VGFRGDLLAQLAALSGDEGARRLLKGPGLQLVPVDDPGVLRDVDTPADLDEDG
jgi:molybdenum cofactor cytidylyltransferase